MHYMKINLSVNQQEWKFGKKKVWATCAESIKKKKKENQYYVKIL